MSQPDLLLSLERAARELRDFTAPVFTSPHKDEVITLGLIQQAADALDLARAEIQGREGYVMVPREPTDKMLHAGDRQIFSGQAAYQTYRAMLRAAATDTGTK